MAISRGDAIMGSFLLATAIFVSSERTKDFKKNESDAKKIVQNSFHLSKDEFKRTEQMVKTDTIGWQEILKALRINKTVKKI